MGSIPHHPFFTLVIESLIPYDRNWRLPYITVMYSTGPLFLSVIWQEYKRGAPRGTLSEPSIPGVGGGRVSGGRWDGSEMGRVRVLMPDEYNKQPWSFFRWHGGSSWHGRDARMIFWMGRHWMLLTASGFLIAAVVGLGLWWIWGRVILLGEKRKRSTNARGWIDRIRLLRMVSTKSGYELIERRGEA